MKQTRTADTLPIYTPAQLCRVLDRRSLRNSTVPTDVTFQIPDRLGGSEGLQIKYRIDLLEPDGYLFSCLDQNLAQTFFVRPATDPDTPHKLWIDKQMAVQTVRYYLNGEEKTVTLSTYSPSQEMSEEEKQRVLRTLSVTRFPLLAIADIYGTEVSQIFPGCFADLEHLEQMGFYALEQRDLNHPEMFLYQRNARPRTWMEKLGDWFNRG